MLSKCKVEASVVGDGWGLSLGPGRVIDLEEEVAPGVKAKDVVDPGWFEAYDQPAAVELAGLPANDEEEF